MALGGIFKTILSPITDLVSEVVVDKDKRDEIKVKLEEIADRADQRYHEELMGQIEVNKVEAQHASIFVAGWRPFIGWTSGVGVAYTFVLSPFIEFIARANGFEGAMPHLQTGELMLLITGMLGLGGLRTYEHVKGVQRDSIK
jgi:hypothetical protein